MVDIAFNQHIIASKETEKQLTVLIEETFSEVAHQMSELTTSR